MKRALITGASGLVGRAVMRRFRDAPDWEALGLAWNRARGDLRRVDITDRGALEATISEFKPNVIIHCAAERRPDVVDKQPDATKNLNVTATHHVCELAATAGAWVLYLSTDYVFDGKDPPYKETAKPNPLNTYGQSKRDGELVVMEVSKDFAILRIPIMYGEIESLGESAVTVLFEKVKDTSKTCVLSDFERRFPTHCDDVAMVIQAMADKQVKDGSMKGIFQWSGDENMTKYDMGVAMATVFGIPTDHLQADKKPAAGAPRPYNAQLDCGRIERELGINKRTKFADGIKAVLDKYNP